MPPLLKNLVIPFIVKNMFNVFHLPGSLIEETR
jgi:hypothetical protein